MIGNLLSTKVILGMLKNHISSAMKIEVYNYNFIHEIDSDKIDFEVFTKDGQRYTQTTKEEKIINTITAFLKKYLKDDYNKLEAFQVVYTPEKSFIKSFSKINNKKTIDTYEL